MSKELIKVSDTVVTRKDIDDWLMGSGTKLTEPQKALFYQISSSFNLNPAKREIYAIPYGSGFNVIVGFEVYLKRAERSGMLEWWEATVDKRDDEWVGTCTIKRTDRSKPTTIEAWFREYDQGNKMWQTKPRTMIRKVAIAQAFRMLFSDELGGMPYTSDETSVDPVTVELLSVETATGKMPTSAPEAPALDVSKFDKAVKKLKWSAETHARLEKWLSDTATAASSKKGEPISVGMIKVSCAGRFDVFQAKFQEWVGINYPIQTVAEPEPEKEPEATGPAENEWPEAAGAAENQEAPSMAALVEQLNQKGWPVGKLQIKFGKSMGDWGEKELSGLADMLADLAAEVA